MLLWDPAHFDSSAPPGVGMLGLGWVPSTLPSVPLPSVSLQALCAQAEDGSRSDMVGFESLGSEEADAAYIMPGTASAPCAGAAVTQIQPRKEKNHT